MEFKPAGSLLANELSAQTNFKLRYVEIFQIESAWIILPTIWRNVLRYDEKSCQIIPRAHRLYRGLLEKPNFISMSMQDGEEM